MPKMKAAMAAVLVMEKEGITQAFGVPGAAINPLYAALRERESIGHILARHVEAASHMAEGYTRAVAGNIGVCIGTSGPAGTDMITGLYSASADSIPILCITGQAPRARLHKEDFQAVDIATIAKSVTKWATTVLEPAQVPRAFQQAFHLMRSGRPGPVLIDLPFDVQMAEIEFDIDTYEPLPAYKPAATRAQAEKAMAMRPAIQTSANRPSRPPTRAWGSTCRGRPSAPRPTARSSAMTRSRASGASTSSTSTSPPSSRRAGSTWSCSTRTRRRPGRTRCAPPRGRGRGSPPSRPRSISATTICCGWRRRRPVR